MEIKIYKTDEISDELWNQIVGGFNKTFEDHSISKEELVLGYKCNGHGYAYHAICFDLDSVIGFNSITPYEYVYKNKNIILGLSGSTFVLKEYRKDIFIFNDMYQELKKYCLNEGLVAFLGVPNSNSYQYSIKILKCKEVMNLSYYVLPVKIFNILGNKYFSFLNLLSYIYTFLSLIVNIIICFVYNFKEKKTLYRIFIDDDFLEKRFSASRYKKNKCKNKSYAYTIYNENGIKSAYIMDFREGKSKSLKSLINVIWKIFIFEKVDIIMYIGTMNLKQSLLIKLPKRFHPRKLPFTFNILDNTLNGKHNDMSIASNWDFSLLNLDVR